uniref:Uncharacterized protein n=1 Tax=Aquila chrysaetos chrysaetos TaxID=223781 RepID=A0A663FHV5_AQUCH
TRNSAVCHGLWFHVDDLGTPLSPCWGLVSTLRKRTLTLSRRADSVAWNPHKMLTVGLQCSAFLLRDTSGVLQRGCHGPGAQRPLQHRKNKFSDVSTTKGTRHCSGGPRSGLHLKLWLPRKSRGGSQRCDLFYLRNLPPPSAVRKHRVVSTTRYCFCSVPHSMRGEGGLPGLIGRRVGKVSAGRNRSMMVGYQPHGARVNFFRQIVTQPRRHKVTDGILLDEIERLGQDL